MAKPAQPDPRRSKRPLVLRKRGCISLLRDIVGHATTETVIMIPLLVAIWGGIWYTHGRYRKAINMAQFTRAHIWQHAFASCEGSPPGSTRISTGGFSGDGFIGGVTELIVGSGIIPGFQFQEVEARRDTSIERPAVLGEGTVRMGHTMVLMCNETVQGERSFARDAWGVFF